MLASPQFLPILFSLGAVLVWGTSDFLGGYATRRADAFVFTTVVNAGGLVLIGSLAAARGTAMPAEKSILWALAAGVSGGASLAVFYRALSSGRMGLTAPVAAVLSAAIPALVAAFTDGPPGLIAILGFFFAAIGLWLITRTEDGNSPQGIGMALIAGIGFAGFYLCIRQAGEGSAFWMATLTRVGGLVVTGSVMLAQRKFHDITNAGIRWGVLAGGLDSLGTVLFVRASQTGRLDEAVVISSLYPAITVLLARLVLKEHFTRWRFVGLLAALVAVPMIATR